MAAHSLHAQAVQIETLERDVGELKAADKHKTDHITQLLVAIGRMETRLAIWGVIATLGAPLIATGAAWMVVRSAGAQVVVPAIHTAAPAAATSSNAVAGARP